MDAAACALVLNIVRDVVDPRRHNFLHPLPEMIVMAIIAMLTGCDGWDDIAEYCQEREEWFKTMLDIPHGVPSHDTFGRVFARLDPMQLEAVMSRWMTALHLGSAGKLIAIDGKSLRRSFKHAWDSSGMAHIVSAFVTENRVALSQLGVLDKENEITAIPKLLAMLDLKGATVTIDAIGCQREIAGQITAAKGHYVLQVKDNQPMLLGKVKALLAEAVLESLKGWRGSLHKDIDGGHGRIETRTVWLTSEVEHLGKELLDIWPGLKSIAAIERVREVIGKGTSTEWSYYILSDGECDAERAGAIIRGHWGIENGLHHVLDVTFNEDQSRVRKGHAAENLSRLRRLTANLIRQNPSRKSIRLQRKKCSWTDKYLLETLFRGLGATPAV